MLQHVKQQDICFIYNHSKIATACLQASLTDSIQNKNTQPLTCILLRVQLPKLTNHFIIKPFDVAL